MPKLTPVPGAEDTHDDGGNVRVEIATCGVCGRSWNDAQVSSWTPAPSARCPFEYDHESGEYVSSLDLSIRQRVTLADAIDAYRSVRVEDREWMRLHIWERFSPADLDSLQKALLEGTGEES